MKLIRRKSDNLIQYAFNDGDHVLLNQDMMESPIKAFDVNTATHEVVDYDGAMPSGFVGGVWSYDGNEWVVVNQGQYDSLVSDKRERMLSELTNLFNEISRRPVVDTGLGFSVHGRYNDVQDFEIGKELGANTFAIGVDNVSHPVTPAEFDGIITAIKTNGLAMKQHKWGLRSQIMDADTLEDLDAIDINSGWPS